MIHGRSRNQVKQDKEQFYGEMEKLKPREAAEKAFKHEAYKTKVLKKQSVAEYIAEKYNITV